MGDGGRTDEAKGRLKEAAGSLTDDDELKREGQADQAAGKLKQETEKLIDKVKKEITGSDDDEKDA